MLNQKSFSELALSFPGTEQTAHFDRIGFKVIKRRMFATYLPADNTANIFLTPKEQSAFCTLHPQYIFPVPNKWGEKGATTFVLAHLERAIVQEALLSAYNTIVKG